MTSDFQENMLGWYGNRIWYKTVKLKSSANNQLLNQANTPELGQVTGAQQKVEFPTQPPRK